MTTLDQILTETGYLVEGEAAPGLVRAEEEAGRRRYPQVFNPRGLAPDAVWTQGTDAAVFFKQLGSEPSVAELSRWRQVAWNHGVAPLLWLVSPDYVRIYNCYARPTGDYDHEQHLLATFRTVDDQLRRLDEYAGRFALETGQFWRLETRIDRRRRVDRELLEDLRDLERVLSGTGLDKEIVHGLIGRSIFVQYLIDREILSKPFLKGEFGAESLGEVLQDRQRTYALFRWVKQVFNGDMFPPRVDEEAAVDQSHLNTIADTLQATNPITGQGALWPYRFDVIPIELISSIYEQFAHSAAGEKADSEGLHYTPVNLVHLVLDEVLDGAPPTATVLDLTCGSGVFLVEALRRLVWRKVAPLAEPTRALIHETLRDQIFGVDANETAVRIAAFSLYLAVLELDPSPTPPEALRFPHLIGRNLFIGDAFDFDETELGACLKGRAFDAIVGNPPWTYGGRRQKARRRARAGINTQLARSPDQDFVWRAQTFSSDNTRFGVVLKATPFFSRQEKSLAAREQLLRALGPVTLVDLSALRDEDLFPIAQAPAMVLLARCRPSPADRLTLVKVPWSPTFKRLGSFELSPEMIQTISLPQLAERPVLLKLAAFGSRRDLALFERLSGAFPPLESTLSRLNAGLEDGFQVAGGDALDASTLVGLPMLKSGGLRRFGLEPVDLPAFPFTTVHRSRSPSIYRGPLTVVAESLPQGRCVSAATDKTVVYSESYFGAAFPAKHARTAHLLAAVLNSALVSWFVLMTGAEFGVNKRRVFRSDLEAVPFPGDHLDVAAASELLTYAEALQNAGGAHDEAELRHVDERVFAWYGLSPAERTLVWDGLAAARGEFRSGRSRLNAPTSQQQVHDYADTLATVVNGWLRGREILRSEVMDIRNREMRIVRFYTDGDAEPARSSATKLPSEFEEVLVSLSKRLKVDLGPHVHTRRVLRVYGESDFFVIKPAATRYWTASTALNDGDAVIAENFGRSFRAAG